MVKKYYPDSDDIRLLVSRGLVLKSSFIHKYGATPQINNGATASIWDKESTLYPWSAFNTPGILTIATVAANGTVSTDDNGKQVVILGLDENFNEVEETLTISGSSATGEQTFARVYRAYVVNGGTSNLTTIKVSRGGTEVLRIQIGKGQTLMSIYTVPAGKTGYLWSGTTTCQKGEGMTIEMFVRYGGEGAFRIGHEAEVSGDGGPYRYDFTFPIPLPEKTDIDVRAIARTNNIRATAAFDILLIDNSPES